MFEQTQFISANFTITFARRERIRRDANLLEDKLEAFASQGIRYFQPQVIPVPDELDPRVPRIIFGSEHGFSQIVVSQVSFALQVNYSTDWQIVPELGQEYLRDRIALLFELYRALNHEEATYCGINNVVRLPSQSSDEELVAGLSRKLLAAPISETASLRDIHVRTARVVNNRFFSNFAIENYRDWHLPVGVSLLENIPLPTSEVIGRGVSVTGDFNDRQAFNEQPNYHSSEETAQEIVTHAFSELNNQVNILRD